MEATVSYLLMLQKCINSKQKIQKKKLYPLCLGNILKDFTIDNMKKKGMYEHVYNFSFDNNITDILVIHI